MTLSRLLLVIAYFASVYGVEPGYVGVDLPGPDLAALTGITSALACALQCDNNPSCNVWVWSYPGSGCPTNANQCWLKSNSGLGTRFAAACRELGFPEGQIGVDRSGGDLAGMPINLGGSSGPSACAAACKSTSGCVAWSFDSCGKQNCWLKSSVTGTSSSSCRISGIQGNVNVDLPGTDMPGSPFALTPWATATDCSNLCSTTAGCNSFAFGTPGPSCETTSNCWLKTSTSGAGSSSQVCRASLSQPGLSPSLTKIGYAFNENGTTVPWSTGKVSWYYTWSVNNAKSSREFVPMLWGPGAASAFQQNLNSGVFSGSTCILGFNEPDQSGQANLTPAAAVSLWNQYLQPLAGRYRLGAPVVSSASGGKPWLASFLNLCTGCTIDFIPLHWYGSDANLFEQYVADIYNSFGKNIWVTEFACVDFGGPPCDQNSVYGFMGQTTLWLDQQTYVERYSWFGVRESGIPVEDALLTADGTALTPLGNQLIVIGGHQ